MCNTLSCGIELNKVSNCDIVLFISCYINCCCSVT
nr:MAG TPA: hypothetical protein [Caudoviricetes sp.]DAQ09562.1 MAG TPA: hypothetical protein [Caudoviricetes sp.]